MESESRNIYKNARKCAGYTQERWAEAIGCSADSVRNYEAGTQYPSDELVRVMCEISGISPLMYWHICRKEAAANELPEVERLPLPQAVIQLLGAIKRCQSLMPELIDLAADGEITADEAADWEHVKDNLGEVIKAALQVKYAEGAEGNA